MIRQLSMQVFPKSPHLMNDCLDWVKKNLPTGTDIMEHYFFVHIFLCVKHC